MRITRRNNLGFTAVEIAMVASVIAILALLILPVFRQRAEEARQTAAADELQSLVKALLLVEADMPGGNFLPRLNDLDNRAYPDKPNDGNFNTDLEPPRARWVRGTPGSFQEIADPEYFASVVPNWKGPYIALKNATSLATIQTQFPLLTDQSQGPIAIFGGGGVDGASLTIDRYPIDPWGSPYMLFGPEETIYNVRTLYSLGADGLPGSGNPNPGAADYDRRTGILGTGDDFEFIF